MTKEHRLERRGRTYYLRAVIPAAIRHLYPARQSREIRKSLRTADKRMARVLCQRMSIQLEQEFRTKLATVTLPRLTTRTHLTPAEERQLMALWTRSVLETDEAQRVAGLDDEAFLTHGSVLSSSEGELRRLLAQGRVDAVMPALDGFLHLSGLDVRLQPEARRRLAYRFLETAVKTIELQQRRQQGGVVATDDVVPQNSVYQPGSVAGALTFEAAFSGWRDAKKGRPSKTINSYRQAWDEFHNLVKLDDVRAVTRAHVKNFVKQLEAGGSHYRTTEKKAGMVGSVFERAVIDELLPSNPASRIEVTKPAVIKKPRVPYEVAELKAVFGHPLFHATITLPERAGGEAARWLPVLAYYTGARIEELAQLRVVDVKEARGLGWYIAITDDDAQQHLKTVASRRRVPLRNELIELGLLRYVERVRQSGQHDLFPHLKRSKDGKKSSGFSRWYGRFLREQAAVTDKRKTFNSFRHLVKDLCREAGLDDPVQRAMLGHTRRTGKRDAAELYGNEQYPLKPLFAAIRRLEYPDDIAIPVLEH
jgi:integrase